MKKFLRNLNLTLILTLLLITNANAGIIILGTRFVFEADKKEIDIQVQNPSKNTALVQVWLENANSEIKTNPPFTPIPPLFKIAANSEQNVRILKNKANLAQDRETLFYINFLDIPPKTEEENSGKSFVKISINSSLKFFYRPKLKLDRGKAEQNIEWRLVTTNKQTFLQAKNKSPYYISLDALGFKYKNKTYEAESKMIAPFSSENFKLENFNLTAKIKGEVIFKSIDDFGNKNQFKAFTN